jgi:hypothetical protein
MIDPVVLLAPILLLAVVGLFRLVGCSLIVDGQEEPPPIQEVGASSQRQTRRFSADSLDLAFRDRVGRDNLLVVAGASFRSAADGGPPASITVTDTRGTPYTVLSDVFTDPGGGVRFWIAFGVAPSPGACTVTVDPDGTTDTSFSIDEFSGVDPDAPLEVDGESSTGSTTTPQDSLTTTRRARC